MGENRGSLCGNDPNQGSDDVADSTIRSAVTRALEDYFRELDGHDCNGLYRLVLREVEVPLLQSVLEYTGGNQTRAAQLLGLNRATLRKKLRENGLINNHEK
ncbi:DNA-binding transcriptional regulator Fis [Halorhodospira halochloris]|uniref:DNA-binding transcriptional regulator Fis n=1 Tax=Halorhodospira halochloris TaxID=1052 RepID=UPI001EE93F16|nr:DNA-binding transcriptional regulator Fis [Halorhodospira halochloris]MCG5530592.1 DNA-binding transcriptional regulator Fis [Halorhodospira halochloris]MCG5547826.1 DNA-binding transcriptional regulator Fis [Halorhodospira halochloris]